MLALAMLLATFVVAVGLLRVEAVASGAEKGIALANSGSWSEAAAATSAAALDDPAVNAYAFSAGIAAANSGNLDLASEMLAKSAAGDDYPYAWLDLAGGPMAAPRCRRREGGLGHGRASRSPAPTRGARRQAGFASSSGIVRRPLTTSCSSYEPSRHSCRTPSGARTRACWLSVPTSNRHSTLGHKRRQRIGPRLRSLASGWRSIPTTPLVPRRLFRRWRPPTDRSMSRSGRPGGVMTAPKLGLDELASADPRDFYLVEWCRRIAAERGQDATVARYDTWLWLAGSPALAAPVARVTFEPTQSESPVALEHYGSLYRRSIPDAQVIIGLPQLIYQDHP